MSKVQQADINAQKEAARKAAEEAQQAEQRVPTAQQEAAAGHDKANELRSAAANEQDPLKTQLNEEADQFDRDANDKVKTAQDDAVAKRAKANEEQRKLDELNRQTGEGSEPAVAPTMDGFGNMVPVVGTVADWAVDLVAGPGGPPAPPKGAGDRGPTPPGDDKGTLLDPLPPAAGGLTYPIMGDKDNPGFEFVTAGAEYKWIGGDSSRVIRGDKREIVGATSVSHVNSSRTTHIAGPNMAKYMSGDHKYVQGGATSEIYGDQVQKIYGARNVRSQGPRQEINIGIRTERWFAGRNEFGFGVRTEWVGGTKFETITGIKHTTVLGAKIDHVKGAKVEVTNGPATHKYPNVFYAIGDSLRFNVGSKARIKAAKLVADAEAEMKKNLEVQKNIEAKGDVSNPNFEAKS